MGSNGAAGRRTGSGAAGGSPSVPNGSPDLNSGLSVTSDTVFFAKNRVEHFVREEALAEFDGAGKRRYSVARIRRRCFDGAKHYASAIFGSGFGSASSFVGSGPRAGIDFCVRAGFRGVYIRLCEFRRGLLEIGDDVAGFDEDDFDVEGIEFEAERVAKAFEGVFAAAVGAVGWRGDEAGYAADHE